MMLIAGDFDSGPRSLPKILLEALSLTLLCLVPERVLVDSLVWLPASALSAGGLIAGLSPCWAPAGRHSRC